jgi:hypothetical protein
LTVFLYTLTAILPKGIISIVLIFFAGSFQTIEGPAYDALTADFSTSKTRDKAYSLTYLGFNLGYISGASLAGILFNVNVSLCFLLNAASISKLIKDDPENLTTAAKYYIDMLKTIHSIDIEDNVVPDMKKIALSWADFVSDHIPSNQAEKLHRLIEAVPKVNKLMHGDYNSNKIIVAKLEPEKPDASEYASQLDLMQIFTDNLVTTHVYESYDNTGVLAND